MTIFIMPPAPLLQPPPGGQILSSFIFIFTFSFECPPLFSKWTVESFSIVYWAEKHQPKLKLLDRVQPSPKQKERKKKKKNWADTLPGWWLAQHLWADLDPISFGTISTQLVLKNLVFFEMLQN